MSWNLRENTRRPEFVWKLALGVLAAGILVAWLVQAEPRQATLEEIAETTNESPVDEEYEEYRQRVDQYVMTRQWSKLWWILPQGMWLSLQPGATAVALITGICWFVFLLQAGQPHRQTGVRWWLAALAVPLGVLSIWPTLFAIYWQEEMMGIVDTQELQGGLKYFIVGVALREELSKLLLFLPLVPSIIRRGSEREALIIAACVGLGFAMEENINYIMQYSNAPSRFLTANFFHMAITGLVGLYLCRAIWNPRERAAEAGVVFLLAVFLHGLYNSVQALPSLEMLSLGVFIIVALLAFQFFGELRKWWQPPGEAISLTTTFLVAVALVVSATIIYLSTIWGLRLAALKSLSELLAVGLFAYMFLREVPESIIDV